MKINIENVTFGTDYEVFLRTSDGAPFPVCGLLGGTKTEPRQILEAFGPGFAVQEDNAAAELNIPPTSNTRAFTTSVELTRKWLAEALPPTLSPDYHSSSLEFPSAYLQIPQMKGFGCEPDFNAWTMMVNTRPVPPVPGFRSAAAHVHVGWPNPDEDDVIKLVKLMDIFVSLPAVCRENDTEKMRRKLYGKAGSFRFKPYGLEHRVLGNRWIFLRESIEKTLMDYRTAILAFNFEIEPEKSDIPKIITSINSGDNSGAEALANKYHKKLLEKIAPGATEKEAFSLLTAYLRVNNEERLLRWYSAQ